MRTPEPLPPSLDPEGFTVSQARKAKVSRSRLASHKLHRPFHATRSTKQAKGLRDRTRAYRPRLRGDQAFGGPSAAVLWGLPLPVQWMRSREVHLLAPRSTHAPSPKGIQTRRIVDERFEAVTHEGTRVTPPVLTWCLLARHLSISELVIVGDAIVTDADNYPGLKGDRPLATLVELERAAVGWSGMHGAAKLRAAVRRIREHVESPKETEVRLELVDGGLPEPEVQGVIIDPDTGSLVARCDLVDHVAKIVYEYEGDHHRERGQFRRDITRQSKIEDCGYHVVRVTEADLWPSSEAFIERVRRLRAARLRA